MRRILAATLNRLGHTEIVEATNGREGMDRLAAFDIDMIVTDWIMPEMDGIDFIRAVRATEKYRDVPVLMVTTNATREHIVEAVEAGASSYIVKPFAPDTLREKIEALARK
jgi:two-component system chemotaxis response regulator CheY